jgi:hypothetical protein
MAVRSKTSVFRSLIAGIAVSNPALGIDVCLVVWFVDRAS